MSCPEWGVFVMDTLGRPLGVNLNLKPVGDSIPSKEFAMPGKTQTLEAAKTAGVVSVTFLPEGRTVTVNMEDLPYGDHGEPGSILDVALHHGIDLEHACGGVCACSTCHIHVLEGMEHLSEFDEEGEADMLDQAPGVTMKSRLGCQSRLLGTGDVTVSIPGWNRNAVSETPHH